MAHETGRQRFATTARGCCRTHNSEPFDLAPAEVCAIVEAIHIDELSEEFDGRLGAIELFLRHIDVINEDEELCIALDTPDLLALTHELAFDVRLSALTLSSGREIKLNGNDWRTFIIPSLLYEHLDDHRLSSTCGTSHEDRFVYRCHHLKQSRDFLGINGGHDELEERCRTSRELERLQALFIVNEPECLLGIDKVFVNRVFRIDLMLGKEITHHVIQEAHCRGTEVTAKGPVE